MRDLRLFARIFWLNVDDFVGRDCIGTLLHDCESCQCFCEPFLFPKAQRNLFYLDLLLFCFTAATNWNQSIRPRWVPNLLLFGFYHKRLADPPLHRCAVRFWTRDSHNFDRFQFRSNFTNVEKFKAGILLLIKAGDLRLTKAGDLLLIKAAVRRRIAKKIEGKKFAFCQNNHVASNRVFNRLESVRGRCPNRPIRPLWRRPNADDGDDPNRNRQIVHPLQSIDYRVFRFAIPTRDASLRLLVLLRPTGS